MNTSAEYVRALFANPVAFGQGALRHTYWSAQKDIMRSMVENELTAVKGCNGSGKAYAAADGAIYWLNKFPDGKVICTSPSETQLNHVLFGYIRRNLSLCDTADWTINQLEIKITNDNYMLGFATNTAERFSGWHGRVLIIIDEAPGVQAFAWEAIAGIRAAGNVHVLALGNPTIPGGQFYDAFTAPRSVWNTISVDAFDTPNLRGLTPALLRSLTPEQLATNVMPQITRRRWVLDMLNEHGEQSPIWEARVRGRFPSQSPHSLYALADLERAQRPAPDPGGVCVAGIDVAGPGKDETALTIRCGDVILKQIAWSNPDPRGELLLELQPYAHRLQAIFVDADGIGHYLYRHLADEFGEHRVYAVRSGAASAYPQRFANYKAEIYWALRDRLRSGAVRNLLDREAFGQATGVRYRPNSRGQIEIEQKEAVKKRTGSSPDRLESQIYAFITPPDAIEGAGTIVKGSKGRAPVGASAGVTW